MAGPSSEKKHALILGASGISGWALMNQIRTYPTPTTFDRITGTTNRPYSLDKFQIPDDPRIRLVSWVDFAKSVDEVVEALKAKVEGVSHVYFAVYIHTDDFDSLRKVNINLLEIAIKAIDGVSENLQYFVLQTGGKGYGLEFPDEIDINTPFRMDMPRIPKPCTMYHIDSDTRKDQEHKQLRKHMSQEQKLTFMREHGIFVGQPGWEWTGKDDSKQLPEGSVFAGKV